MIVFDPFWETMRLKGITQYQLIKEYRVSHGLLDRMRKNQVISLYSVNKLCQILNCQVSDVCMYVPGEPRAENK